MDSEDEQLNESARAWFQYIGTDPRLYGGADMIRRCNEGIRNPEDLARSIEVFDELMAVNPPLLSLCRV